MPKPTEGEWKSIFVRHKILTNVCMSQVQNYIEMINIQVIATETRIQFLSILTLCKSCNEISKVTHMDIKVNLFHVQKGQKSKGYFDLRKYDYINLQILV